MPFINSNETEGKLVAWNVKDKSNVSKGDIIASIETTKADVDLESEDIHEQLSEWQHYYNWERPHSAHNGKTPIERYFEVSEQTPFSDEIEGFVTRAVDWIVVTESEMSGPVVCASLSCFSRNA